VDSDLIRTARMTRFLGVPPEVHESLGSTNDEAFRRAHEGAPEGLVVLAGHQTAGKGRLGRSWFDQAERSLMFSILLRPAALPLPSYPLLSLALASSAAWIASDLVDGVTIKWPNDVLCRGRKLCGVLAESRALRPGEGSVLVLGVGMNVNYRHGDFPDEIGASATSLSMASGEENIEMGWILTGMLEHFGRLLAAAYQDGPEALRTLLLPHLPEPGSHVKIALGERSVEGELIELTETGALRVRDSNTGAVETLTAGVMQ
jgi:BirA family biotin operon repressor/biotin-[acetyl-CoA-carboxylase] ligase